MRKLVLFALLCVAVAMVGATASAATVVPRVDGITVDGDLSDWVGVGGIFIDSTMATSGSPQGCADLSALAFVGYDDEFFYLAVRVTDDVLFFGRNGGDIWQTDCVELWINDAQIGFAIDANGELIVTVWSGGLDASAIHLAIVEEVNGYTVEAAIPAAEVGLVLDLTAGTEFMLAIGVDDSDIETASGSGVPSDRSQIYYPASWAWRQTDTYAPAILGE